MFEREAPAVRVGDRFTKSGDSTGRVWVVIRLWTTIDGLPHARMKDDDRGSETRIISVSALVDRRFYAPAPPLKEI